MATKCWMVDLEGPPEVLVAVSSELDCQHRPWVDCRDGKYFLSEHRFACCQLPAEVRMTANDLLSQINSFASTFLAMRGSIRWKDVRGIDTDGTETIFLLVQEEVVFSSCRVDVIITDKDDIFVTKRTLIPSLDQWTHLFQGNEAVRTVERLRAGQPADWVNLNRILEIIEKDLGGKNQLIAFSESAKDRERFRRTANHPATAGDLARHGVMSTDPPPAPMSIVEARFYIDKLRVAWVQKKIREFSDEGAAQT